MADQERVAAAEMEQVYIPIGPEAEELSQHEGTGFSYPCLNDMPLYVQRRRNALRACGNWNWTEVPIGNPNWNIDWIDNSIHGHNSIVSSDGDNHDNNNMDEEDVEHCIVMFRRANIKKLMDGDTRNKNNESWHDEFCLSSLSLIPAMPSCPITVQWLMDNYETAEGVSLPRSTLYYHYFRHCAEHKLDPVNAASFGKLIRSVFLGLRTRRLGTRGNSKYHYCGIRMKPSSPLNNVEEPAEHHLNGHSANSPRNRSRHHNLPPPSVAKKARACKVDPDILNGLSASDALTIQQYLGDPSRVLDDFPDVNFSVQLPEGLAADDFLIFRTLYRENCEVVLEDIVNFQLGDVEKRWRSFWRTGDSQGLVEQQLDNILSRSKLELLCSIREVREFVRECDYRFYQGIVGVLLPDVLRPIPSAMTQAIRYFAKCLEGNLTAAMTGISEEMVTEKVGVVNALAQTLRRYTSLNHLAQAARAVLQNQTQINQMLSDLNRVDFHNVEEQASWVCGCDGDLVPDLEADFKATFAQQQSLEQWAQWLEGVVDRVLRPHVNSGNFLKAAKHFLLHWSFYSSLIIRDLTLRSAASFGSLHLLRLLYDEYIFYLVEKKVADVTGTVSIAVIGKKSVESTSLGKDVLVEEESHTQSLVNRYLNDHQLQQNLSVTHSSGTSNGINGNASTRRYCTRLYWNQQDLQILKLRNQT